MSPRGPGVPEDLEDLEDLEDFEGPRILAGVGSLGRLPDWLEESGWRRPLVVTGPSVYELSGAREVLETRLPPSHRVWNAFGKNLSLEDIRRGVEVVREHEPDVIIALGGGSSIDMGKHLAFLSLQTRPLLDILERRVEPAPSGLPLVAVPTTVGSGSEVTHFAVVFLDGVKRSLAHERIRPRIAVLDPRLLMSLPSRVLATTAMDALCQAIESFWAVQATAGSRVHSRKAMRAILEHLPRVHAHPTPEGLGILQDAAHHAGRAIDTAKTTAPHALSYGLTYHHGVPHGQAVGVSLPEFVVFNSRVTPEAVVHPDGVEAVRDRMEEIRSIIGGRSPRETAGILRDLMTRLGLETSLSGLGVTTREARLALLESVNPERLANNPLRIGPEDLIAILDRLA